MKLLKLKSVLEILHQPKFYRTFYKHVAVNMAGSRFGQ